MQIYTKPFYKRFSVVHNYFLWMCPIIERIYDDRIPPKCHWKLIKLAKMENLKIWISTKPCYKLLSVVHNYFLWMYIIIQRIYDDRISPKCHWKLIKLAKMENLKMWISTKPCYKLLSVVHNYFLWMYIIIERIYDDRISPKCHWKLRKIAKKENLKMQIYTKPFYKLFSVVHNYFLWMCLIIERIYDDRIPPKCHLQMYYQICENMKTWNCEYLLNHAINFSVWFTTTFYECI